MEKFFKAKSDCIWQLTRSYMTWENFILSNFINKAQGDKKTSYLQIKTKNLQVAVTCSFFFPYKENKNLQVKKQTFN